MIHSSLLLPCTLANRDYGRAETVAGPLDCQVKRILVMRQCVHWEQVLVKKNDMADNDIFSQKWGIMEVFILQNGIKETQ